jgi:hypothetical protein
MPLVPPLTRTWRSLKGEAKVIVFEFLKVIECEAASS